MATKKAETITIPELKLKDFALRLVGDSPLIVHAWSEKAKKMMLDKQMKKATTGKETRNPAVEYARSLYWLNPTIPKNLDEMSEGEIHDAIAKATFGFPVIAFKAAAVDAGYQQKILDKKTTARGAFHIIGGEYAVINGMPSPREDMVKIGMGTADLRFRAMFTEWSVELPIRYNSGAMSAEEIINLFNVAGFSNGVGEWRPSRDGDFGRFHVYTG